MRSLLTCAAAISAAWVVPSAARGDDETVVRGTVLTKWPGQEPAPQTGAVVYVVPKNKKTTATVACDADGKFQVEGLKPGVEYTLWACVGRYFVPQPVPASVKDREVPDTILHSFLEEMSNGSPGRGSALRTTVASFKATALPKSDQAKLADEMDGQADLAGQALADEPRAVPKLDAGGLRWEQRSSLGKEEAPGPCVFRRDVVSKKGKNLVMTLRPTDKGPVGSEVLPDAAAVYGPGLYRVDLATPLKHLSPGANFGVVLYPRGASNAPSGPFVRVGCDRKDDKTVYNVRFAASNDDATGDNFKDFETDRIDHPLSIEIDWRPKAVGFRLVEPAAGGRPANELKKWEYKGKEVPPPTTKLVLHLHLWCEKGKRLPGVDSLEVQSVKIGGKK